jgi:hypothetical protein
MLAEHLKHFTRPPLAFDPELVSESVNMDASFFNLFVQQNYHHHYPHVGGITFAANYLSDADLYLGQWDPYSRMDTYASSVAIRGLHC